jgi:hypothetical protein
VVGAGAVELTGVAGADGGGSGVHAARTRAPTARIPTRVSGRRRLDRMRPLIVSLRLRRR